MRCEIITIGDELINGRVMNLNGWYASGKLTALGFGVGEITSVGDNPVDIAQALTRALDRSDFLIVTGGLGPTEDDITTRTVADLFERPLTVHNGVLKAIERFLEKRGLPWNTEYEKLALLPEGAIHDGPPLSDVWIFRHGAGAPLILPAGSTGTDA